jgi:hypothetical protein
MKYKLVMVVANIKHTSWWWNGKSCYEFEVLEELLNFMSKHIPLKQRDVDFIRKNDENKKNGGLADTSWYRVEKGEHQMTDYTSF